MGAKCDYREKAREQAESPRELTLVNELLTGRIVRTHRSTVSNRLIVGLAGLQYQSWEYLYRRLLAAGLLFTIDDSNGAISYRMTIPAN